eukprot:6134164-Pyramimonas_sp.AAC.1
MRYWRGARNVGLESIAIAVDTGACNAGPPSAGTHSPVSITGASNEGKRRRAANGPDIRNHGQVFLLE